MKTCKICQETLPYTEFNKNHRTSDGHLAKCKKCLKIYVEELKTRPKLTREERNELVRQSKEKAVQTERRICNNVLEGLGYDIEGELSIHQQFLIKHGLLKSEHQVSC